MEVSSITCEVQEQDIEGQLRCTDTCTKASLIFEAFSAGLEAQRGKLSPEETGKILLLMERIRREHLDSWMGGIHSLTCIVFETYA